MKIADLGCVDLSMWDARSGGLYREGARQVPGQEGRVRYGCGFIESGILIYVTGKVEDSFAGSLSPYDCEVECARQSHCAKI